MRMLYLSAVDLESKLINGCNAGGVVWIKNLPCSLTTQPICHGIKLVAPFFGLPKLNLMLESRCLSPHTSAQAGQQAAFMCWTEDCLIATLLSLATVKCPSMKARS